MDVVLITLIATIILAVEVPSNWFVAWRYFRAWHGGETIRYFAPTVTIIVSIAATASACLLVAVATLFTRVTSTPIIPPGIGLLIIALALTLPSAGVVWLLFLLRDKTP